MWWACIMGRSGLEFVGWADEGSPPFTVIDGLRASAHSTNLFYYATTTAPNTPLTTHHST